MNAGKSLVSVPTQTLGLVYDDFLVGFLWGSILYECHDYDRDTRRWEAFLVPGREHQE